MKARPTFTPQTIVKASFEKSKELAYIASPYGAIRKAHPKLTPRQAHDKAVAIAKNAALYVRHEMGYVPVSPILTFDGVFDEYSEIADENERDLSLEACALLLKPCGVFVWTDTVYNDLSEGMYEEKALAESQFKRIEEIPFTIGA